MPITAVYDAAPAWALANLVAASTEFQRAVDAANATEALEFVHFLETIDRREGDDDDDPMEHPRPRAIIDWDERTLSRGGIGVPEDSGALTLSFELLTENLDLTGASNPPTHQEKCLAFMNCYGRVIHEMFDLMGASPHDRLQMKQINLVDLPTYIRDRDEDFWGVSFQIPWF